jgi:hypothetical protein
MLRNEDTGKSIDIGIDKTWGDIGRGRASQIASLKFFPQTLHTKINRRNIYSPEIITPRQVSSKPHFGKGKDRTR